MELEDFSVSKAFFSRILIIFYGKFNIRALKFVNTA